MHLDTVNLCAVSEDSSILLLEVTEQVKLCATSPRWIAELICIERKTSQLGSVVCI